KLILSQVWIPTPMRLVPLRELGNDVLLHQVWNRKHSGFDLRKSRGAPINYARGDELVPVKLTRTEPLSNGHAGACENVFQCERYAGREILDLVEAHHRFAEPFDIPAGAGAQMPVPLQEEVHSMSSRRKLIIE